VVSDEANIKWNFQDFEVRYRCEVEMYKIKEYFLKKLIVEKPGEGPKLACEIL